MAVSGANDTNKDHQSPNTGKSEECLSGMIEPLEIEKDKETTEAAEKTGGEKQCVNKHVDVQDASNNVPTSSWEAPHKRFYHNLSTRLPKSVSKRNEEPESSDEACCARLAYVFQRKALDLVSHHSEKKIPPVKPPKPTPEAIAKASVSREAYENEVRFREKRTQRPRPRSFGDDIPVCKGIIQFIDDSGSEVSSDYPNVDLYQFITVRKHDSSEADYSDNGLYEIPDEPNTQKEAPASEKTILPQERENASQISGSSGLQKSRIFPKLSLRTNFKEKFFKPMLGKTSSHSPSELSQANSEGLKTECETKRDQREDTSSLKEKTVNTSSKIFSGPTEYITKTYSEIKTLKQLAQEKSEVTKTQFLSASTKESLTEAATNDLGISVRPVPPARSKSQRVKHVAKSFVHEKSFMEQNESKTSSEEKAIPSTDITYTQNEDFQEQLHKPKEEITNEKSLSEEEVKLAEAVQNVNCVDRLIEDEEEGSAENVKEVTSCDNLTEERKSVESCKEFSDVDLREKGLYPEDMKESTCFDKEAKPVFLDKQMEERSSTEKSKSAQQGGLMQETYYAVPKPAVPPRPKRLGLSSQRSLQVFNNEIKTKTHPPRPVSPGKKASNINKQGRSVSSVHKTARPNSSLNKTQRQVSPSSNAKQPTSPMKKVRPISPSQKLAKPPKVKHPFNPISKQQNERPNTPASKGFKPIRPPRPLSPQTVCDTLVTPQRDATTSVKLEATSHLSEAINFAEDVKDDNSGSLQKSKEFPLTVGALSLSPRAVHKETFLRKDKSVTFADEKSSGEALVNQVNFEDGVKWRTYRTSSERIKKRPHTVMLPLLKSPFLDSFQRVPSPIIKASTLPLSFSEKKTPPQRPPPPKIKQKNEIDTKHEVSSTTLQSPEMRTEVKPFRVDSKAPSQHSPEIRTEVKPFIAESKSSQEDVTLDEPPLNTGGKKVICSIKDLDDKAKTFSLRKPENLSSPEQERKNRDTWEKENKEVENILNTEDMEMNFKISSIDKSEAESTLTVNKNISKDLLNQEISEPSRPPRPRPPDYNSLRRKLNYYEEIQNSPKDRCISLNTSKALVTMTKKQPRPPPRVKRKRSRTVEIVTPIWKNERKTPRSQSLDECDIRKRKADQERIFSSTVIRVKAVYTQIQKESIVKNKSNSSIEIDKKFEGYQKMKFRPLPPPPPPPRSKSKGLSPQGEDTCSENISMTRTCYNDSLGFKESNNQKDSWVGSTDLKSLGECEVNQNKIVPESVGSEQVLHDKESTKINHSESKKEHSKMESQLSGQVENNVSKVILEDQRSILVPQVDENANLPDMSSEPNIHNKNDNILQHYLTEMDDEIKTTLRMENNMVKVANSVFYSQRSAIPIEPVERQKSPSSEEERDKIQTLQNKRKTKLCDASDLPTSAEEIDSGLLDKFEESCDSASFKDKRHLIIAHNEIKQKDLEKKSLSQEDEQKRYLQFCSGVPENELPSTGTKAKCSREQQLVMQSPDLTEKSVQTVPVDSLLHLNKRTFEQSESEDTDELTQDLQRELKLILERHKKKGGGEIGESKNRYDERGQERTRLVFQHGKPKIRASQQIPVSGVETTKEKEKLLQSSRSSTSEISWQEESSEDTDEEILSLTPDVEETAAQKKKRRVFYIAQEIMTSEKLFVDVLRLLNEGFRRAVGEAEKDQGISIIPEETLNQLLKYFPQLQNLNENLLRELQERIEHWPEIGRISDILVTLGPFLKLYSAYIRDFESTINLFEECKKKYPLFSQVVKEFEMNPHCQKLSLNHYMLKPVQRIPQYRLLLQNYLHHLHVDSPDYEDTVAALEIMSQVADHANETMKQEDNLSKLITIQNRIFGHHEVIRPGRVFIKEGELMKLSRKIMQPRWFILFNDSLLYVTKVQNNLYRVNHELQLTGMRVSVPIQQDYQNEFSIVSVTRSFSLAASSPEVRDQWINALSHAIEENACKRSTFQNIHHHQKNGDETLMENTVFELGQRAPIWIPDVRVTMCQLCTSEFTVTFRRHHCRACGKVVCSACSASRAPLCYLGFRPVRVCDECFPKLQQEYTEYSGGASESADTESDTPHSVADLKAQFKENVRHTGKKIKRNLPSVLKEVSANDQGSSNSGYLQRRGRRGWKRYWFVIKDKVLYMYKASEDVAALASIPLLGYTVKTFTEQIDEVDGKLLFQLTHPGQPPVLFQADTTSSVERWIRAMEEATVLE